MEFAKAWIEKVFDTPRMRKGAGSDIAKEKSEAFSWLKENFGATAAENHNSENIPAN